MPTASQAVSAAAAGTITLGDLTVNRLGYGAMRITGKGIWGPPADHAAAIATLRRAVELGVNFIDTADSYGPNVSEEIIAEALAPTPPASSSPPRADGSASAPASGSTTPARSISKKPSKAASSVSASTASPSTNSTSPILPSPSTRPWKPSLACAKQGKIQHVALSNVTLEHLERARKIVPIVSVQNRYSFADREWDFLLDHCEKHGIAFIPWAPLGQNRQAHDLLDRVAKELHATPLQVALAWLLAAFQSRSCPSPVHPLLPTSKRTSLPAASNCPTASSRNSPPSPHPTPCFAELQMQSSIPGAPSMTQSHRGMGGKARTTRDFINGASKRRQGSSALF